MSAGTRGYREMNTIKEVVLITRAEKLIEMNAPFALSKMSPFNCLYVSYTKIELFTDNSCIIVRPVVATNSTPLLVQTNLHTTLEGTASIDKTNGAVETSAILYYRKQNSIEVSNWSQQKMKCLKTSQF